MSKKLISENNPQGVEYPEAVTADGKLVSAIEIEKGDEAWEGIRFYFPGCEADNEEEMLFIQRSHKNGFTKFFRHRPGYIGDRNEPDRYLHNYAELRLKQRFDESQQSNEFLVQYYVVEKCPKSSSCKFKVDLKCKGDPKPVLKTLNLRKLYDTCNIEKGEDKYIADLLLTNSQDKNIKPMFLEVFVTHKCTNKKIASGYPIIEIKINSKEDADYPIIENAGEVVDEYLFMQSENKKALPLINFYGFNRDVPFNDYIQYGNFSLTKNENELVAECRAVACNDVEKFAPENRAFSLSVPINELKNIDIYEMGMAKAQDLGLKVRDCSLCGRYKIPTLQSDQIDGRSCRLIHVVWNYNDNEGHEKRIADPYVCWMPYRCTGFDKSKQATACRTYFLDRQRISNLVQLLEKTHKLFWVDESLLPTKPICIEKPKTVELVDEKLRPTNPKTYEHDRKLLTPQECFSCTMYSPKCRHCLGAEMKDGRRYVVCDYHCSLRSV
jgi:hypothetical protein